MRLTRYRFGEFELDPASRELRRDGALLALPLKSLECLAYLVAHRERAVGRDELISAVWGRADVSDTVITQTMRRARKALDDAGNRQVIVRTVPGFGYRWVAAVEEVQGGPASTAAAVPAVEAPPAPQADTTPPPASVVRASGRGGHWRWWLAGALAVLAAVAVGIGVRMSGNRTAAPDNGLVMVLPVTVRPADAEYNWVRLGAMEYAAGRLRGAALKVAPTEQTLHLSATLDAPDANGASGASDALLRRALEKSGARWLLVPQAEQDGGRWRVQLRAIDRGPEVRVEAQGDTPLRAMAVATDAWLRRIGRGSSSRIAPTALQERLQRVDAELDAGQLEAAREQIAGAPPHERNDPRMQVREGQLAYRAGRIAEAQTLFERALASTQSPPDVATRAKGLMGLGAVDMRQGRLSQAEDHYTQALEVLQKAAPGSEDSVLLGNAYNGRGVARVQRDNLEGAVRDLGLARVAMQQDGDVVSAAMVGSNLGRIEAVRNHWAQAVQEYDSAIAVFDQYQVQDYLVATLCAKAQAQLALVQPVPALQTLRRADGLDRRIEDVTLRNVLEINRARVYLANGRLDDAGKSLRALSDQQMNDSDGTVAGLEMAVAVASGDRAQAASLAARVRPASARTTDTTVVMAVQAAGHAGDARAWLALMPQPSPAKPSIAALFANAVVERRFGDRKAALAAATDATALANREGSQDDRLRTSVVRALLLREEGDLQAALGLLGELDAYVGVDYRVAWLAWTLYRQRGDAALAERARKRMDALRGQRPSGAEPLL